MSYAKQHIIFIAEMHRLIDENKKDIKVSKKRLKKSKKKLNKYINEPVERFMELSKHSKFLNNKDFSVYPVRSDGLSVSLTLYISSIEYSVDMGQWIGIEVDSVLIESFNEMIELIVSMHDLDINPPKVLDWDKDISPINPKDKVKKIIFKIIKETQNKIQSYADNKSNEQSKALER